jgi:GTP cyclohydrolase I
MAAQPSTPQMAQDSVTYLTWDEVYRRLESAPPGKLYGIPRGGAIVAGLLHRAVPSADEADVIVDDIVDSGATRTRYATLGKPFWALYEKQASDGWVVFPWEAPDPTADIATTVTRQLEFLGEDPTREGLRETPARVIHCLQELTRGYHEDPTRLLGTVFTEACDQLIIIRDIPFFSLCEHHLLPFHGTVSVGYLPHQHRVVGLSKIPRVVQCFARRLQVQERLTQQIAQTLHDVLKPLGVGVLMRAEHLCMRMRGVESRGLLVTSCLLGALRDHARAEFLALLQQPIQ